jgi:hypothetical protein
MSDFTRKKPVDLDILRKQILAEARQYTDASIEGAIESLLEKDQILEGRGGADEISLDLGIDDLIPSYEVIDPTPPGVIESVKFLNDSGTFDYNENFSYGTIYISSDGQYAVDVTAKAISTNQEISSIEVQITRIDNAG